MATETTTTSAPAWSPDVTTFAPTDVIPDALVLATSTVAGFVEGDQPVVRVAYVTDAAAGFVAEGANISEADPGLDETDVATGKVAQLVKISREQWDHDQTPQMLAESVARAVTRAANIAYISQVAPTPPAITPPAGLLNITGITDGGTLGTNVDTLVDAIAGIEDDGGNATHIITAPDAWATLAKLKGGTGSEVPLIGAPGAPGIGTEPPERRLLGLPVLVSSAVTTGTLLVVDRAAIVSAVGPVTVATSEHVYFNADAIALRCTFRFGANAVHPARIVTITTA